MQHLRQAYALLVISWAILIIQTKEKTIVIAYKVMGHSLIHFKPLTGVAELIKDNLINVSVRFRLRKTEFK